MNFRIVKSKAFELEDKTKGTVFTVAHSGRVLTVSTLNFEKDVLTVKDNVLSISGEIEVVKKPYTNSLGESVQGLSIMPKFGLTLSEV